MDKQQLADKTYAGWMGKNIGGTLGGPLEGIMQLLDVRGYTQAFAGPVENDDLDLQLVNLHCAEQYGGIVTTQLLAQEWKSHVFFEYDEYGHALTNMRKGMAHPLAGAHDNFFTDCMGSPIRSEIWGMVCAGHPDLAAYYAHQDASVDHAGGEGMYGEIFFAVLESLAFECDDISYLIETALSYIPETCTVYKAVRHLLHCHAQGLRWQDARQSILDNFAGENFTYAPVNIAFTLVGLLYEKGFTAQLLATTNCGYDTDCTCATIASILGILYGTAYLDKQWTDPLGENIIVSEPVKGIYPPKTISALTERTLRLRELILARYEACADKSIYALPTFAPVQMRTLPQASVNHFDLRVTLATEDGHPAIAPGAEKSLLFTVENGLEIPYCAKLSVDAPAGCTVSAPQEVTIAPKSSTRVEFTLRAPMDKAAVYPIALCVRRTVNGLYWTDERAAFALVPTLDWRVSVDGGAQATLHLPTHALVEAPTGKLTARTTLVVTEERDYKLVVTCCAPVTLTVDGKTLVNCDAYTPFIPAYHRSDERKCATLRLTPGAHDIVLTAEDPERLNFYAVSTVYSAENIDTLLV